MVNFITVNEAQRSLKISSRVTMDIVEYAFKQQNLFRVFRVDNKYLIDRKTFSKWLKLTQY